MSIVTGSTTLTPEDLLALPDYKDFELVNGQLVERNMSTRSSLVGTRVVRRVGDFAESQKLGDAFASDLGYQCFPDDPRKVRRPDGSFVCQGRISEEQLDEGYLRVVPDLAIEVLSPNDLSYETEAKIEEYLEAGVRQVWVVNPETRIVSVHRLDGTVSKLHSTDVLSGEDVLPGFSCRVSEFFEFSGRK